MEVLPVAWIFRPWRGGLPGDRRVLCWSCTGESGSWKSGSPGSPPASSVIANVWLPKNGLERMERRLMPSRFECQYSLMLTRGLVVAVLVGAGTPHIRCGSLAKPNRIQSKDISVHRDPPSFDSPFGLDNVRRAGARLCRREVPGRVVDQEIRRSFFADCRSKASVAWDRSSGSSACGT
jgi:hypothetical protein